MSLKNFLPLRREIQEHWTYKDNDYLKLWLEILFCARFSTEPKTNVYKSQLYTLNQGEFLFSRRSWSNRLNISEGKVRTFIKLALQEEMIKKVGRVGKRGATIFSVTNYKHYNNCTEEQPTESLTISEVEGNSNPPTTHQQPTNNPPTTRKEERKKEKKEKQPKKTFLPDSYEYRIANYLLAKIKQRNPGHRQPNLQSWAKEVDKMIRIDKRDIQEIGQVIDFCQADSFWQNNILSTKKLRDKYDQLKLKMQENQTPLVDQEAIKRKQEAVERMIADARAKRAN